MNKVTEMDPRGEYQRVCPYCGESFTAHHMHQIYCPEKNGHPNYCKNRQKRINDRLKEEEIDAVLKDMTVVLIPNNELEDVLVEVAFPTKNRQPNNISIIESFLGALESVEVEIDLMIEQGFEFDLYDQVQTIPDTSLNIAIYGEYAIVWSSHKKVLITHKTTLTWIF